MDRQTLQQLRGVHDLVHNGIHATVNRIEAMHQEIAQQPYALLAQIDVIAAPVHAIEQIQHGITSSVYAAIRSVNQMVGSLGKYLLDRLEVPEPLEDTTKRTHS